MLAITAALMVGTAGLPHVIIRFYTVPKVRDARTSAGWYFKFVNPAANVPRELMVRDLARGDRHDRHGDQLRRGARRVRLTPTPPSGIGARVESIRVSRGAGEAHEIGA